MEELDKSYTTSYQSAIFVSIALCRAVFELFDVEKCRPSDLDPRLTQDHWK